MSQGAYSAQSGSSRRRAPGMKPWLWRALLENFWLKVIALVVALGFYASLHPSSTAQRTLQVPIVADMPPPTVGRELLTEIPQTISVTVEGPRQQLDNLESKLDPIPLNLRSAHDDVVVFTPEMISGLPPGVRVTRIIPESLVIRWENAASVQLEVQVPITGQLAQGLELKGVTVRPARVTVDGPESAVKGIQLARTEPFDIGGLGEGQHTRSLTLAPPPPNVSYSTRTVEATVEVARRVRSSEYDVKVQVIGPMAGRAKTEPATVRVVVEGAPERIDSLRPDSIIARVELKGIDTSQPGTAMLPVLVDVADAKVTVEPAKVLVKW